MPVITASAARARLFRLIDLFPVARHAVMVEAWVVGAVVVVPRLSWICWGGPVVAMIGAVVVLPHRGLKRLVVRRVSQRAGVLRPPYSPPCRSEGPKVLWPWRFATESTGSVLACTVRMVDQAKRHGRGAWRLRSRHGGE